jgi:peptidyl-prolyl cis-trans isomerase SurA
MPATVAGTCLRAVVAAAAVAIALATAAPAAFGQQLAALVNGEPITALDVAQRMRMIQVSTNRTPSRAQALDELIDEKLKLQAAKRFRIEITNAEVDAAFANIASRARTTPEQFAQVLTRGGISVEAFKTRMKADMAWQQIIRGKFRESFQIRERDVFAALQSRAKDDKMPVGYEYTLRPILLIVPRGSPEAAFAARRREAENLRARFQDCTEGIRLARNLKDVAIRSPIVRTSGDFSAQLRQVLESTEVGRLTPPEVGQQGIQLFAVCAKKQVAAIVPGQREVQEEMIKQRFQAQGESFLKELRRSAMIEYR